MHIGFLNPQGNFDPGDSYLTQHPDFGGQLLYVKQVALAMATSGHKVDIITRQIIDPDWPEFAGSVDHYPGVRNLRILRLPAGPPKFLRKELLWQHIVQDWVGNILQFYRDSGSFPDAMTAHYGDGGLAGVLINLQTGIPFTFTGHSLGAQKMDKLEVTPENLAEIDNHYRFRYRIFAERLSMNYSALNITSTKLERFEEYSHRAYQGAVDVNDDDRFAVIPPGSNLAVFSASAYSDNELAIYAHVEDCLKRDLHKRATLPAIIAASHLYPKKNQIGLLQAFAHSQELQDRANLVIIAGGLSNPLNDDADAGPTEKEVLAAILETVEENNLWGKVSAFSVGTQPALAATYRYLAARGSVFALTALDEPFGLAPLEAAAAGLPVVVTKKGSPSETLREGDKEYGVLVDPEDPADIARGLELVLCDRAVWHKLAIRGQKRAHKRYTWARTAEGYLTQLEKILASATPQPRADLLPIPPYFQHPEAENDISIEELSRIYWGL